MKKWILSIVFLASRVQAIEPLTPINFGGGVDYSRICSEIADERACDSSNMIGDREGGAQTRNGSHRLNETAVSTNPFNAFYWTTIATGTKQYNVMIGVSGGTIYGSTDDVFSQWRVLH